MMTPKIESKTQLDKFKEAARELECDEDEQRFAERLGKIAKPENSPSKGDKGTTGVKTDY